jgi:hypothetical protein
MWFNQWYRFPSIFGFGRLPRRGCSPGPLAMPSAKPAGHRRHNFRPCLEALEDRYVPSTILVTSNADNGAVGTLRWAVAQATPARKSDIIAIVTTQPIVLTQGSIGLQTGLTIEGANNTPATVSGGFTSGIFFVVGFSSGGLGGGSPYVTLQNLDLIDGAGVAVWEESANLTVNNCTFSGNTNVGVARYGGAILAQGGTLTVNNCAFSGNTALAGGAIAAIQYHTALFTNNPVVSINNSTFSANTATGGGGAIYDDSGPSYTKKVQQMVVSGCSFSGNSAATVGGAVWVYLGQATISSSSFVNNSASQAGSNIAGPYIDGGGNIGL